MSSALFESGAEPRYQELTPDAYRALLDFDGALLLEPRLRKLVEVRTAMLNCASGSLFRHAREAIDLGESPTRLAGLAGWRDSSLFAPEERAALELAEALALTTNRRAVSRACARAAAHLSPNELAQLVFACAIANARNRLDLVSQGERP
jgi:alkylhydroperoxidase family enzyme